MGQQPTREQQRQRRFALRGGGYTCSEIAAIEGVSRQAIEQFFKYRADADYREQILHAAHERHNQTQSPRRRHRNHSDAFWKEQYAEYCAGKSTYDIGREIGLHSNTVRKHFLRRGFTLRNHCEANRIRSRVNCVVTPSQRIDEAWLMVWLYEAGISTPDIAHRFGYLYHNIIYDRFRLVRYKPSRHEQGIRVTRVQQADAAVEANSTGVV